ncbi:hypothetical protein CALCODRAFT_499818, partial [Calocera cornea HHB12733]
MDIFEKTTAAVLAINTGVQIIITLLLGYRLLKIDDIRSLPPEQRSFRYRIVVAIVESGAIIAICLILNLAFLVNGGNIHWTFNLTIPHFYAITTMAIAVRIRTTSAPQKTVHTFGQGSRRSGLQWPTVNIVRSMRTETGIEMEEPIPSKSGEASLVDPRRSMDDSFEMADRPSQSRSLADPEDGVVIHTEIRS